MMAPISLAPKPFVRIKAHKSAALIEEKRGPAVLGLIFQVFFRDPDASRDHRRKQMVASQRGRPMLWPMRTAV